MIVSRGGTAAALKERNFLVPVVEIPVTSSAIAASIRKAFDRHGEMPVGVVGTVNAIRGVHFIPQAFSVPVKAYTTAGINRYDLIDGMERAVADGCKLILAATTPATTATSTASPRADLLLGGIGVSGHYRGQALRQRIPGGARKQHEVPQRGRACV